MSKSLLDDFLSEFNESRYPEGFLAKFELLECLSVNQGGETLLVRNRETGVCFVAKCYTEPFLLSRDSEGEILRALHHPGLPVFEGEYQNDVMRCVVREYVKGVPLQALMDKGVLADDRVISIGLQICDVLAYIHAQQPPVIHRDIKPQNIIIGKDGAVRLIDFGISRRYDKNAKGDTVCFGTAEFAPPEQYGFSQTDGRADIFSLGVLQRYLLTGETGEAADAKIDNKRLRRIIARCTAFSPRERYADAGCLRRALMGADGHRNRNAARIFGVALAGMALIAAGFIIGRHTQILKPAQGSGAVASFSEPLIEQAVRQALGKQANQDMMPDELAGVTELYIWGNQIATNLEDYYTLGGAEDGRGSLSSLSDLALLPNLQVLMVGNQQIKDISPIAGLNALTELNLDKNPVKDISPVSQLQDLEFIGLNDTKVSDLTPLASCTNLKRLVLNNIPADDFSFLAAMGDIEYLHIMNVEPRKVLPLLEGKAVRQLRLGYAILPSMADLEGVVSLQELFMDNVFISDLSGIEKLSYLTSIQMTNMPVNDLSPLLSLPYLRQIEIDEGMCKAAEAIADRAHFEIVCR